MVDALTETLGYELTDYTSGDAQDEVVETTYVPGICLRVTKGASPREQDEDAMVEAMMVRLLGEALAKNAGISIYPKALTLKYVAEASWPVTVLQCDTIGVYRIATLQRGHRHAHTDSGVRARAVLLLPPGRKRV